MISIDLSQVHPQPPEEPKLAQHTISVRVTPTDNFLVRYNQVSGSPLNEGFITGLYHHKSQTPECMTHVTNCAHLIPMVNESYIFKGLRELIGIEITKAWWDRHRAAKGETE